MTSYLASVFANQGVATLVCAFFVALWAVLRPASIRDYEERPLPPNLVVQVVIVLLYIAVYLTLVGMATIGGQAFASLAESVLDQTSYIHIKPYVADMRKTAPGLAFFAFFGPLSLLPVRELERRFLVWMHRGTHLNQDGRLLALHLAECTFVPSPEERQRSIKGLRAFNVFLTQGDTSTIKLVSVEHWRKVNALLELMHTWNPPGGSMLSANQQRRLALLAAAHERKTGLALGIVSLLARDGDRAGTLAKVSEILDKASHDKPAEIANSETTLAALLVGSGPRAQHASTRVAPQELEAYLQPINDYFAVEYQLLLEDLTQLAAQSLMYAGDRAATRLDDLKRIGFCGLGYIERMDMARLLMVLFSVGVSGFATLFAFRFAMQAGISPEVARDTNADMMVMLASISLIMAAAALIGAYAGSNGEYARAARPPWGRYLRAGLFGVLAFFLIHGAQFALMGGDPMSKRREAEQQRQERILALTARSLPAEDRALLAEARIDKRPPAASADNLRALGRIAPFALLPFFIVVGMCLLARLPRHWRPAPVAQSAVGLRIWDRTLDGFAMCAILFAASALAMTVASALGLMPPRGDAAAGAPPNLAIVLIQFAILGFAIGAIVVRDVRLAAHTRMVETRESPPARPPPAAQGPAREMARAASAIGNLAAPT